MFNDKISHRMQMTVGDISTSENILMFTEGHGNHFKTAFNLFKDNKVFGHGANMFRKKCSERNILLGHMGVLLIHIIFIFRYLLKLVYSIYVYNYYFFNNLLVFTKTSIYEICLKATIFK